MAITGAEGEPPHKTATTIADFVGGTNTAAAICAALAGRATTARGRLIEVSLRDGLLAVQAGWNAQFFATGRSPRRTATASPVTAPNQTFRTADGHLNLAVVSDGHFSKVCRLLGLDQLCVDSRYVDNESRVANRESLAAAIEAVLETATTDQWMEVLVGAGLAAGRLLDLPAVFDDPQVLHNEMVVQMPHPAGSIVVTGSPVRLDGSPARTALAPPLLGADSRRILESIGLDHIAIDRLAAAGRVRLGAPG